MEGDNLVMRRQFLTEENKNDKYFGYGSKEELMDCIVHGEPDISYGHAGYLFTLDGRGWNLIMTHIENREADEDTQDANTTSADTIEALFDKVVLYDGKRLIDAFEMTNEELAQFELQEEMKLQD